MIPQKSMNQFNVVWAHKVRKLACFKKLSLYSPYYAEARNDFAVPISESERQVNNTATCVDVEAVANRLQRCIRFGRPEM